MYLLYIGFRGEGALYTVSQSLSPSEREPVLRLDRQRVIVVVAVVEVIETELPYNPAITASVAWGTAIRSFLSCKPQ